MVFSDLFFIYFFLPLCLFCYYITKNIRIRNIVLTIFSLFFYSFGEPVWVGLLIISALVDYCNGLFIEKHRGRKTAVLGVVSSLVINLGILFTFKYSGFLVSNINAAAGTAFPVPSFALPIGISFYTFQTISYTVDVYRGKAEVQHDFFDFLLYVSMFFQLVAGPIIRYSDISKEIADRTVTADDLGSGLFRFIWGFGKKVLIANTVGAVAADRLTFTDAPDSVLAAWAGVLMFSLQIYFDFSGYSDMAIGLGRMFGFHFPENFNYPYISRSASEFWRRWHISLGSFFRDYVYIPMGGNRRHQLLNIAVVWFLTGLWHGASWNFILWGLYFGVLVSLEKVFLGRLLEKLPSFLSHIYLIFAALFGWALFYFTELDKLGKCLFAMFGGGGVPLYDAITLSDLKTNVFVIIAAVILCCPLYSKLEEKLYDAGMKSSKLYIPASAAMTLAACAVLIISSILLVGKSYNPFIYYRY